MANQRRPLPARQRPAAILAKRHSAQGGLRGLGRWPVMAGLVLFALIVLAWVDGGEEPLHPIVQPVQLPGER